MEAYEMMAGAGWRLMGPSIGLNAPMSVPLLLPTYQDGTYGCTICWNC